MQAPHACAEPHLQLPALSQHPPGCAQSTLPRRGQTWRTSERAKEGGSGVKRSRAGTLPPCGGCCREGEVSVGQGGQPADQPLLAPTGERQPQKVRRCAFFGSDGASAEGEQRGDRRATGRGCGQQAALLQPSMNRAATRPMARRMDAAGRTRARRGAGDWWSAERRWRLRELASLRRVRVSTLSARQDRRQPCGAGPDAATGAKRRHRLARDGALLAARRPQAAVQVRRSLPRPPATPFGCWRPGRRRTRGSPCFLVDTGPRNEVVEGWKQSECTHLSKQRATAAWPAARHGNLLALSCAPRYRTAVAIGQYGRFLLPAGGPGLPGRGRCLRCRCS